jgi:hypothetical protein
MFAPREVTWQLAAQYGASLSPVMTKTGRVNPDRSSAIVAAIESIISILSLQMFRGRLTLLTKSVFSLVVGKELKSGISVVGVAARQSGATVLR